MALLIGVIKLVISTTKSRCGNVPPRACAMPTQTVPFVEPHTRCDALALYTLDLRSTFTVVVSLFSLGQDP